MIDTIRVLSPGQPKLGSDGQNTQSASTTQRTGTDTGLETEASANPDPTVAVATRRAGRRVDVGDVGHTWKD
jgi:hypothetical protein